MNTPDAALPTDGEKKPNSTGCGGCLIIVGIIFVLIIIWIVIASFTGDDEPEGPNAYLAETACEDHVKDRLKSPSTAEFDLTAASTGGATFEVTGTVDSQNSFGAMVRNNVVCSVEYRDETYFSTVDLLQ